MSAAFYHSWRPGSLRFGVSQIPDSGLEFRFEEAYQDLPESRSQRGRDLACRFLGPIRGWVQAYRVATKVNILGAFETEVSGACDSCGKETKTPIEGDLHRFLMPDEAFSKHDKPGGKVIHAKKTQTRRRVKARKEELLDAPGEHEDVAFGAFDGQVVDLRPFLWEEMILQLPMRMECSPCRAGRSQGSEGPLADEPLGRTLGESFNNSRLAQKRILVQK